MINRDKWWRHCKSLDSLRDAPTYTEWLEQQLAEVREVVQASLDVVDACAGHDWHRCEQHNLLDKISALSDALKEKNNEVQ